MYPNSFKCFLCFVIYFSLVKCSLKLYCRDENNKEVDWFVNYKIPKIEKGFSGSYLSEGKAYTYLTSSSNDDWTLSSESITSETSMLGVTLDHFFSVEKMSTFLLYNDEPPSGYNGSAAGHLKGIIAFDETSGFWLIHSIPKFPSPNGYEYPSNALSNGQSVLCISFPTAALTDICHQLLFSHPKIYKYGLTDEVLPFLDEKAKSLFSKRPAFVKKEPFASTVALKSLENNIFISFAKDNQLNKDLYSKIVAPHLKTALAVQTWRRGSGTFLPPYCKSFFLVLDINSITMRVSNASISFKSTEDHSKWAISIHSTQNWICIGDINRMESQGKRGGGTVCFQSNTVWNAYNSIIASTDLCPIDEFLQ